METTRLKVGRAVGVTCCNIEKPKTDNIQSMEATVQKTEEKLGFRIHESRIYAIAAYCGETCDAFARLGLSSARHSNGKKGLVLRIQRLGELRTEAKGKLSGHDTSERPQTGGRERQKWKRLNTCTTVFTKTPTIAQAVPGKGLRPVAWTDRMKGDNGLKSQSLVIERLRKFRNEAKG